MVHISAYPPELIAPCKVLFGGSIAAVIMIALSEPIPCTDLIILASLTGFFSYGLGLILFIVALWDMGAVRAGAIYAASPFIGCFASLMLFAEPPSGQFWIALPLFVIGALIVIFEQWKYSNNPDIGPGP